MKIEYTHVVTFDQPLYLKARGINECKGLPIVCRLGGLHLLMSILGSMGNLMKGSGLEEFLRKSLPPTQYL